MRAQIPGGSAATWAATPMVPPSNLNLSEDPWLHAMHALHVAARPEALPCRGEEYSRVLRAVEELLEEGSGGCVCGCSFHL